MSSKLIILLAFIGFTNAILNVNIHKHIIAEPAYVEHVVEPAPVIEEHIVEPAPVVQEVVEAAPVVEHVVAEKIVAPAPVTIVQHKVVVPSVKVVSVPVQRVVYRRVAPIVRTYTKTYVPSVRVKTVVQPSATIIKKYI